MKTDLMNALSGVPAVYNEYFYRLSNDTQSEPPPGLDVLFGESSDSYGKQLGEALVAEFEDVIKAAGESEENTADTTIQDRSDIFDAAKIGFTLIKVEKSGPFWAVGERRGI